MSKTKEENWDLLSRQHEHWMNNPAYRLWLEYISNYTNPLTEKEKEEFRKLADKFKDSEDLPF